MRTTRRITTLTAVLASAGLSACIITTGPDVDAPAPPATPPVLRMGEISETLTGTWAGLPGASGHVQNAMRVALRQPGAARLFSGDPSALTLDIALVVDHQSDEPRLMALGLMSIVTLGAVPLYYSSEWSVSADAIVRTGEGLEVARYPLHEKGIYRCFALPPTMFGLLGAGIRGDNDGKAVYRKTTESLAAQLITAVTTDYERLAKIRGSNVPSLAALGDSPVALLERGRLHLAAGRIGAAKADVMSYADHDPRLLGAVTESSALDVYDLDGRRQRAVRATALARRAEADGQLDDAFAHYREAYAWTPEDTAAVEELRASLIRIYPRLLAKPKLPEPARRFFLEGEASVRTEQYEEASVSFGRAAEIAPWFATAHYNRALVLERLERYGDAVESIRRFLDLEPDSAHARAARDRLYQWQAVSGSPR